MKSVSQQQNRGTKTYSTDQDILKIEEFLLSYPGMAIKPSLGTELILDGDFEFTARNENHSQISDSYRLKIKIPSEYPKNLPIVEEIGKKIPQNKEFHVNPDGSLCLGSRLRLLWEISKKSSLLKFAESFLVPYLYAISYKKKYGGELLFGELDHGLFGELKDFADLVGLKSPEQAKYALQLIGMKKRLANKKPCPCGCGVRLGKCKFNDKIRDFRGLRSRSWFRSLISD
ncbi:MAG: hypothetical protein ACOC5F_03295 [Candidatus Aminicenantaceae bacterium]